MALPILPQNSRWQILEETQSGDFRVRCTCGSGVEKTLARRYVRGESLSCGCLAKEKAREQGKRNLASLRVGYQEYVKRKRKPSKYASKLPDITTLLRLKEAGLSDRKIADHYGASRQAVRKRLSKPKKN